MKCQRKVGQCAACPIGRAVADYFPFWMYRLAANSGLADAQFSLARMYASGRGIQQNDKVAAYWYRKAAEQDDAQAQVTLGKLYDDVLCPNGRCAIGI